MFGSLCNCGLCTFQRAEGEEVMSAIEMASLLSNTVDWVGKFGDTVEIQLVDLQNSDSPRTSRTNTGYVRMLADSTAQFPPIIVHRESMRVIDGNQRVAATRLRGGTTIAAVLFDGDEKSAFVVAVRLNVAHGLPLTVAERKAAALRLLADQPEWSDRSIAAVSGISDKTVAAIRRTSAIGHLSSVRIGRNGVAHQSLNEQGRHRAAELIMENPEAPLREVALAAGISLTTVKDVRSRLRRGDDPVPAGRHPRQCHGDGPDDESVRGQRPRPIDPDAVMAKLSEDPSLRFTESGRNLLRRLALSKLDSKAADEIASLPCHCLAAVTELARQRSDDWRAFAVQVATALADREADELSTVGDDVRLALGQPLTRTSG